MISHIENYTLKDIYHQGYFGEVQYSHRDLLARNLGPKIKDSVLTDDVEISREVGFYLVRPLYYKNGIRLSKIKHLLIDLKK